MATTDPGEGSPTEMSVFSDYSPAVPDAGTLVPDLVLPPGAGPTRKVTPLHTYLASLSASSRRPQLSAANAIASFLSRGRHDAWSFPWAEVTYPAAQAVRANFASTLAPATTNRYLSVLRSLTKEAWRLGEMTAEEQARAADVRNVRGTRLPAGRALEAPEVAALLEVCRLDDRVIGRRDEAIVAVLVTTGIRRAELVGLTIADLTGDRRTLMVVGKGDREREVYLNDDATVILDRWLEVRGSGPGPLFTAVSKNGTIRRTGHLSPSTVRDILLRRSGEAELEPVRPHDCRRTVASDLLQRTDLLTVARIGGWSPSSTAVLSRYDRRSSATARQAIDGLRLPA